MSRSQNLITWLLVFVVIVGAMFIALVIGNYGPFGFYVPEKAIGL